MPDYLRLARELRAKANYVPPPASGLTAVGPEEKAALLAKAREFEAKHAEAVTQYSRFTDDTTVTSRDGRPPYGTRDWDEWFEVMKNIRKAQAERIAEDLQRNQWRWNSEYYDQDGKPKPQRSPDYDDIMEETYKYDPGEDEDYGYDEAFGERHEQE